MDLATAIDEYVGMIVLGSEALRRLANERTGRETLVPIERSLDEIQSAAKRLAAIGKDIRGSDV